MLWGLLRGMEINHWNRRRHVFDLQTTRCATRNYFQGENSISLCWIKISFLISKLVLECITLKPLLRLKRLPSKGRLSIIQTSTYSSQTVLLFEGFKNCSTVEECRLYWPTGTLLTLENPVVTICTTTFNSKFSAFCPTLCMYVCVLYWSPNKQNFPIQNWLIGFYSL